MAISVNWPTKVISIPKADTTLIQSSPFEIRELNLNTFRLTLKDLEDDESGIAFPITHNHNPPVTVGGVTLARVVEIINDYTITFENGNYAVNLVGANSNVADRLNLNQVSVRAANSAGLVQTREIEHASFNGRVVVDIVNGVAGTLYPTGTEGTPVNNFADALLIASNNKLKALLITENATLPASDFTGFVFEGLHNGVSLNIVAGANVSKCVYKRLTLSGTLDADSRVEDCLLTGPIFTSGVISDSYLDGTITLISGIAVFSNCRDYDPSTAVATIDLGGSGSTLAVRGYYGGLAITNKTGAEPVAIDIQGRVILDSSVNNGTITIRGIGHIEGTPGGGATIVSDDLVTNESIAKKTWDRDTDDVTVTGSVGAKIKQSLTTGQFIALK